LRRRSKSLTGAWSGNVTFEWRATADALRNPALTARLLEPRDAHLEVSLTRP